MKYLILTLTMLFTFNNVNSKESLNAEVLYAELVRHNFPHPDIIVAQAVVETGHFKSNLCVKNHNLFGLYDSNKRRYFKFTNWRASVQGYKRMILNRYNPGENYYSFLKRIHYCDENPEYISLVKEVAKGIRSKQLKKNSN